MGAELNEDELTDLREQFGVMEKEADDNTAKQKELEAEKAKLQETFNTSKNVHLKEKENLEGKLKSHESELTQMKIKLQDSGNSAKNIETLQIAKRETEV